MNERFESSCEHGGEAYVGYDGKLRVSSRREESFPLAHGVTVSVWVSTTIEMDAREFHAWLTERLGRK